MTIEEKLDLLLDEHKKLHEKVDANTVLATRIDERTMQHEKRMDRADRRASGLGAIAGLVGGFLGGLLKWGPN